MGMPGMTNESVAAYAATEKNDVKQISNKMTVTEFRNKINHISHYYDTYDVDDFLTDDTIDLKQKFEVLLGTFVANIINYDKIKDIIKEMK